MAAELVELSKNAAEDYTDWEMLNDSSPYLARMAHLKRELTTIEALHYQHTGGPRPHTAEAQAALVELSKGATVSRAVANELCSRYPHLGAHLHSKDS
jgi:ABC-type transport system involved in cytochrome c biogenesis ATPase subunit